MNGQNEYESDWKKVKDFDRQGLPKSALEIVEIIYDSAKKESNDNQVIKAFLHKAKYTLTLEENAQLTIIKEIKTEINKSEFPKKNVLESILGNLYWQYFQQNRWKFYNRTQTSEKVDQEDFRTWDLETLFAEVHFHYQKSLENGVLSQQTDLSKFNEILSTASNSKKYRPTLYDFLTHNALSFYKTSETNITRPSYAFTIDDSKYLQTHKTFSSLKIATKDSLSLQFNALKLYQNLINFHSKDSTPEALTEVNIERIKFVYEHAVFLDKDHILLQTLESEKEKFASHDSAALYDYEIASLYKKQGSTYIPEENQLHRWKLKKALELCNQTIKKFPDSRGASNCNALKAQILHYELDIKAEKNVPVQTTGRVLISYKNLNKLYFKALKVTKNQLKSFEKLYQSNEQIKFLKSLKTSAIWEAEICDEFDYQKHTTEVVVPKLDHGYYFIVGTKNKELENEEMFSFGVTQVSNIALIEDKNSEQTIFQVLDRNNGSPIANAKVRVKTTDQRGSRNSIDKTMITDEKGQVYMVADMHYYNISITVTHQQKTTFFDGYYLNKSHKTNYNNRRTVDKTYLFTDRSIYRPGQTVYFKGIVLSSDGDENYKVLPEQKTFAALKNVNGQEIERFEYRTNEYGSFSGEFIIPSSGLTGSYSIFTDNYHSTSFSVEEYKRPKFETTFDPITETYKLNDTIQLSGQATAYAGSMITDAKVKYTVRRTVQYPIWCYWYPRYRSSPQEITFGETTTNEKGEYTIRFAALPDASVAKKDLPVFTYEVTADVTDINGETRSTSTIISVGYHVLTASINIKKKLDKALKDNTFTISTSNLNNEPVSTTGTIEVFKLKAPKKPLRLRPWKSPDYAGFKEEEFSQLFPHDAFKNEHDPRTWKKGHRVMQTSFNTSPSGEREKGIQKINLGNTKKWESGKYVIELKAKDRLGQEVKDIQYITLYSQEDKTISDQQLFEITTNKASYAIGDEVLIKLSSASEDISIIVDIEKNHRIISTQLITLSKNSKTIKIPVEKDDLGGFAVNYSYLNYNSYQSGSTIISVPYQPTELSIETATFRDKLSPGQDETWSFTIKGPKGDKVSAELLASMYDASLDQFKPHQWYFNPINRPIYSTRNRRNARQSFGVLNFTLENPDYINDYYEQQGYDALNWFGLYFGQQYFNRRVKSQIMESGSPAPMLKKSNARGMAMADEIMAEEPEMSSAATEEDIDNDNELEEKKEDANTGKKEASLEGVKIRKNLQETAFFFPKLSTDNEGNVRFSFTAPEALTQWKLQLLAHTKNLNTATTILETVTQKELMVIPNPPRFLREGDEIVISSKISNLTSKNLTGIAELQLFDALTNKKIDTDLQNTKPQQNFEVTAKGNQNVSWKLNIPETVQTVQYKIIAKAGEFSDGEQNVLPVLSNRMLVTETLPMWIRSDQTKTFSLDKLKNNTSASLKHHKLTLEMTSNPAWYAVQALPYLMEYPHECAEQTFSRYYANALASHIANSNPRIQEVFNQWKNSDALISNLEKNQELKSLIIQDTPWLRDAESESEQKKRIALLFDLNKMTSELQSAINKLIQMQYNSGGFPWFDGGRENRFITQHIATGFGHLQKLGVTQFDTPTKNMLQKAVRFLDIAFVKEYEELKRYCKKNKIDINKNHLSYTQLHYLYMRSFFNDIRRAKNTNEAWDYYLGQSKKYWIDQSLYSQGMLALILNRNSDTNTATKIIRSLDEKSITNEELGMYWKSNTPSWYWYQAPIETHSLMIEVFSEVEQEPKRTKIIDNLKIWLLKNKQTNRWKTTKATSDAVYALLLQGSDWLSITDMVDIVLGDHNIDPGAIEGTKIEAGTGYFKTSWSGSEIKPNMATAKITKKGKGIAWGALYWQYFEDLDKITSAKTPLSLKKKLFLKKNTDTGEEITEITPATKLELGDLVRVRIELRSDRTMEFVHMKDMRASGLEPMNVISRYKYQDGLGYYESTKDASTNFFFDYLPKGVYVFEYDLRVNNEGEFSNGITTIQSMYAPEFSSHSEGIRIRIGK
ncbi:alpha-2-macroglobulin family protein [Aquimarina pacifica]|uniref:alpha-2-macroglobulin family protein n=1 Tax=Aquimarina pacifica TaxID=1296415 RepID=UPI0004B46543|nr:MG2 domain-containing protein [Aquimarina pacifica]